nr:mitochondrial cardiolipin hydrolase [Osmia lignaria]
MKNICIEVRNNKLLLLGGIALVSELVWQLYKRFHDLWTNTTNTCRISQADVNEPKQNISEVMFFTKDSSLCRAHATSEEVCPKNNCPVRYFRNLENYINQAKESLDICMYMLTSQFLSTAIVNARKRGVIVRMILDKNMAQNDATQLALFYSNSVSLRVQQLDVLMHHKFMIVDKEVLITGSMNWTMSAFFGNFDNILVTNQRSLVEPFVDEFDKLWEIFQSPICPELQETLD